MADPPALIKVVQVRAIPARARQLAGASEGLPEDSSVVWPHSSPGQSVTAEAARWLNVILLQGMEPRSVDLAEARPLLLHTCSISTREAVAVELERIGNRARIEFRPPYAGMGKDGAANKPLLEPGNTQPAD